MSRTRSASTQSIALSQMSQEDVGLEQAAQVAYAAAPQETARGFMVLKLAKKTKAPILIHGEEDVVNPQTKRNERMRLLRGVDTIWVREQKDLPKEYVEKNRRSLQFDDGVCRISYDDTAAIEFVKLSKHLLDNPSRRTGSKYDFFEWNPRRQAEAALAKRKRKMEALQKAMAVPSEEMKKHAIYLNVPMADELGFPKEEDALRADYMMKAEDDPEKFLSSLGSKEVTVSFLVKKAIRDAKIDLGREPNVAYWSAGGGYIGRIPLSRNADAYLTELALTNSAEGKAFLDQLEIVVK